VTGTLDKTTTYYLNQPVSNNIQAIITNLDKTKLYPKQFENEYVEVNIPDFNLRYYKNQQMIEKMGLVVGRIDRPTPLFSNSIKYLVLNPTWTIPDNLIKRDLIHVLRKNPLYLEENNIHVFRGKKEIQITQEMLDPYEDNTKRVPYRFVQFPGESNALGRIKFMFPNKYAVYLHDTDNKSLLSRRYKIYSSGCMRVEKPFVLADILLEHARRSYSQEKIDQILETNKPTTIRLKKAIPVHILYFTVYEEDGLAYFKHDIYLYDKIIEESVEGNKKSTFKIPAKRMISVKKQRAKPLSN
jgi:murein L,D-transpeptidase YcbB/YkuD